MEIRYKSTKFEVLTLILLGSTNNNQVQPTKLHKCSHTMHNKYILSSELGMQVEESPIQQQEIKARLGHTLLVV